MPDAPARGAASERRRVTILGATGSIGRSAADIIRRAPDRYAVEAVTVASNVAALAALAVELGAAAAAIGEAERRGELAAALAGTGITVGAGPDALLEAAARPADIVVSAIVGAAGLGPTLAALEAGTTVALANKECLVCAGGLITATAHRRGAVLLPVDSEHNAIFQVLEPGAAAAVTEVILTASGGPFRTATAAQIAAATPEMALRHPNWSMGAKVTIDSATLMNKGLELIEASHLFPAVADRLSVVVHPQSVVHGLVRYADGSLLAQLGAPDMRTPIAYCLAWPERGPAPARPLDLTALGALTFEAPDRDRFPCLGLAEDAMRHGRGAPAVLNAANEVAVAAFLARRIGFPGIAAIVARTLDRAAADRLLHEPGSLAEALALDRAARDVAGEELTRLRA